MYWLIKTINTPFKLDVALGHIRDALSLIRDDCIKQASKIDTDFTVDLLWWGSLRLAPIIMMFKVYLQRLVFRY